MIFTFYIMVIRGMYMSAVTLKSHFQDGLMSGSSDMEFIIFLLYPVELNRDKFSSTPPLPRHFVTQKPHAGERTACVPNFPPPPL